MSSGRITALDGWRAISAGLVIVAHLQHFSGVSFAFPLHDYGDLGVRYFFGISGFVIARGLLSPGGGGGWRAFYVRRIFRIIPPLLMFLALVVALVIANAIPPDALKASRGLIFACNVSDCGGWFGGHLWSLSVEEQFYFVCPVILLFVRSRRIITAAMLAVPLVAIGLRFAHFSDAGAFVTNFAIIAAGVACAANEQAVLVLVRRAPVWLGLVTFAASFAAVEVNVKLITSLIETLALPPLIMFTLLRTSVEGGRLTRWLGAPWFAKLGEATYTIYLFQQLGTYAYPGAGPAFYVLSVGGVIAWGMFSLKFIERPLIEVGRSLARKVGPTLPSRPTPSRRSGRGYEPSRLP